jgi:CubicO group peptidase (beta-lactamase class C family)
MMSVTKSFAGLLGLMAVEDGVFGEDDLVTRWVPELAASGAFGTATFGQVADMVNSMDFSEDYADPDSGIVEYSKVLGILEAGPEDDLVSGLYDYLATLPADGSVGNGQDFHYQTPKADVVNWVTNRATGKSFQDNIYDTLWSKLGTDGEAYVLLDTSGALFAGGGLNATPNDLARFAVMMLNNGRFNGQQVVPESVVAKLAAGGDRAAFSDGPSMHGVRGDGNWSYRAQWWVRGTPDKEAFTAIGVHGQFIYIDQTRNVAIVKQSSLPVSSQDVDLDFNINAFDAIIEYLGSR